VKFKESHALGFADGNINVDGGDRSVMGGANGPESAVVWNEDERIMKSPMDSPHWWGSLLKHTILGGTKNPTLHDPHQSAVAPEVDQMVCSRLHSKL
jgi:hypothetical protein